MCNKTNTDNTIKGMWTMATYNFLPPPPPTTTQKKNPTKTTPPTSEKQKRLAVKMQLSTLHNCSIFLNWHVAEHHKVTVVDTGFSTPSITPLCTLSEAEIGLALYWYQTVLIHWNQCTWTVSNSSKLHGCGTVSLEIVLVCDVDETNLVGTQST